MPAKCFHLEPGPVEISVCAWLPLDEPTVILVLLFWNVNSYPAGLFQSDMHEIMRAKPPLDERTKKETESAEPSPIAVHAGSGA